ncbi:MAG: hypothetical protein JXA54_05440 [Candidatus Heimdallarchaeota archaeon]|nr:hypothetical protein [Candidatus Heimdallarchaeota archaeon]
MFDKIKRTIKRGINNAVEDEVDRQVDRQVDKATYKVQSEIDESIDGAVDKSYEGMKSSAMKGAKMAKSKTITGSMITDFNKFNDAWEKNAGDPAQSVFYFAIATYNYSVKDVEIGDAMATVILSKKHNEKADFSPSGLKLGPTNRSLFKHMRENPNIAKSYLGANYKNDYKFDEKKLTMLVLTVTSDEKEANVVIQSGGKDFPTPIALAKNKSGQWKITEFSSFATGVRKSSSVEDDF